MGKGHTTLNTSWIVDTTEEKREMVPFQTEIISGITRTTSQQDLGLATNPRIQNWGSQHSFDFQFTFGNGIKGEDTGAGF